MEASAGAAASIKKVRIGNMPDRGGRASESFFARESFVAQELVRSGKGGAASGKGGGKSGKGGSSGGSKGGGKGGGGKGRHGGRGGGGGRD